MKFSLIDVENWDRKDYYNHFLNDARCNYSQTINLDITNLNGSKLYPVMLYLLTDTVNEFVEFRTFLSTDGVGVYDCMNPSYTIFNKEAKTFADIWTEFNAEYNKFLLSYEQDKAQYSNAKTIFPKANRPENSFDVSMLPWFTFTSFNINVFNDGKYLLPIFTIGKSFEKENKTFLPLALQVHHAVCDGYHVAMFIDSLQNKINQWPMKK